MILRIKKTLLFILVLLIIVFTTGNYFSFAEESTTTTKASSNASELEKRINELQNKVNELQSQEKTLSSQIAVMDNQIKLTEYRIEANKEQILNLEVDIDTTTKKIGTLEQSLDGLTKVLLNRIVATYEVGTVQPFYVLLSSNNASNFFTKLNYLKIAQTHDKRLIYETEQAKVDYANQKDIFEEKKAKIEALKKELETYTQQLATEKAVKDQLLTVTRNDEQTYQNLLAQARAEYEAIQGIVAGKGQEEEVGTVNEGQKIATVISGTSCNSGGTHLHFVVSKDGSVQNPFGYLKPVDYENCSGSSCGSADADSFNPSGSWNWPMDPRIRLNQGYGSTWATKYTWVSQIYNFHNGIDIEGSSLDVKAVKSGKLYQGSYSGSGGCRLRYVRVASDEGFETFYLHINYSL